MLTSAVAVTVSPELMLLLPMESALLLVLLTVSVPPTARLLPPPLLLNGESIHTTPLPVSFRSPVVATVAPADSSKNPATVLSPVNALLVARVPASAIRALTPVSPTAPSIVPIWPLANSSNASFVRATVPVSTPGVPNPAAALVMSSVDWMVAPPTIWITPVLTSAVAVTVSPELMLLLPMESALLLVLLTVSVPPIARLLPPPPLLNGESIHTTPLPVMLSPPLMLADPPLDSRKSPATAALAVADRVAPAVRSRTAGAST